STPTYAVRDTILIDSLFVRPNYCHYYFGDYYGPVYRQMGFESAIVYSQRHEEPVLAFERYKHRSDPHWEATQLELCLARDAGRAPRPARTLLQQSFLGQRNSSPVVIPAAELAAAKGVYMVPLDK